MEKLETINIKGKEYVTVNKRMKYFKENFPKFVLKSEILNISENGVTMRAWVEDENGRIMATGHASEDKGASMINKTSYVENCETSAWGRALANFGIGLDAEVCSYDELISAKECQAALEEKELKKISEENKRETEKAIEEAQKNFGDVIAGAALANEKQVTKIKELLFALGQPEDKVLKAKKMNSFSEFTEVSAGLFIKNLEKKLNEAV